MGNEMLEIKNLRAGYGELEILKGINVSVGDGKIAALIGPNGAGKSTVIKSIFGMADVRDGQIIFNGKDIAKMKPHELIKEGICYVNQGKVVFSNLTVAENLKIASSSVKDKDGIKKRLEIVYKKFPFLEERSNELAHVLSGGQRQMLALGRALMQKPSLLLLDEPSLGLSPIIQKELFKTISELRDENKISILIVEQNAKKAMEISDKIYLLEDGNIVLEGTRREFAKHRKIREVYLGGRY